MAELARSPAIHGLIEQNIMQSDEGAINRPTVQSLRSRGFLALETALSSAWSALAPVLERLTGPFLSPGSMLSVTSLGCALLIGAAYIAVKLRRRNRRIRLKALRRALFPRRIVSHASTGIDVSYVIFNTFVFGMMFGWALLSYSAISGGVFNGMTFAFGVPATTELSEWGTRVVLTIVLFLAYELGYWLHHYLFHRVPLFWEFHKVHHTANVLTPITAFRVHPVDTWLFVNVMALTVGAAGGIASYALGVVVHQYALTDTNLILVVFIHVYVHFQHSHLWIAFRGLAGRVFLSPAHHQVHHSTNPVHFNKNLGSCLAVWDWAFGTLHVPAKTAENLTFGVEPSGRDAQTITEAYIASFPRAVQVAQASARGIGSQPVADSSGESKLAGINLVPARET